MMTKKELFNAKNCGKKIEEGLVLKVKSVGQFDDKDKDGNDIVATALATETGEVYTCISSTVAQSIPLLEEILEEDGSVEIKVVQGTSNGGRKFYQLQIL